MKPPFGRMPHLWKPPFDPWGQSTRWWAPMLFFSYQTDLDMTWWLFHIDTNIYGRVTSNMWESPLRNHGELVFGWWYLGKTGNSTIKVVLTCFTVNKKLHIDDNLWSMMFGWWLVQGLYYHIYIYIYTYNRRKFRSQTSDNMERWKAEQGRRTEKRKIRREKIRRERVRGQTLQMREKVGKSRNTVFSNDLWRRRGRKVGSLKRRVRSQLATGAMKNCTPLWREAHFQVKNVQNTRGSDHFWKLRCWKKCTPLWREANFQVKMYKTPQLRTTFGVAMSKKCTPLWREAHFQVKMYKTLGVRTTFGSCDVEKVHAVVARSTFPRQNVPNTPILGPLLEVQMSKKCLKSARRCGAKHISKSKCKKLWVLSLFWREDVEKVDTD